MTLELLIEQRVCPRQANPAQEQISAIRDVAHDVADFVERTGDQPLRGAAAQGQRDVADAITRATGQQRQQAVGHRLFITRDRGHPGESHRETLWVLQHQDHQQHVHDILLARSRTTLGSSRCSASNTLAASESGVSPGSMGTRSCAIIAPRSNCSSTKCIVAPDSRAPLASTASCTRWPYMPGPPNSGSRAGWILIIRPRNRDTTAPGTSFRYPASTTRCASPSAASSSLASEASRSTVVGMFARWARCKAGASGRFEITRATGATGDSPRLSRRACRFVPPPETSTATRTGSSVTDYCGSSARPISASSRW